MPICIYSENQIHLVFLSFISLKTFLSDITSHILHSCYLQLGYEINFQLLLLPTVWKTSNRILSPCGHFCRTADICTGITKL